MTDETRRRDREIFWCAGLQTGLTPTDRKAYLATFPLKLNYSFRHAGWQFIGLDTTEGQKFEADDHRARDLRDARRYPWPVGTATSRRSLRPLPLCENVKMRPVNAEDLLAKFKGWNLHAVFNGHYHAFTECQRVTRRSHQPLLRPQRNNHDGTKEKGIRLRSGRRKNSPAVSWNTRSLDSVLIARGRDARCGVPVTSGASGDGISFAFRSSGP